MRKRIVLFALLLPFVVLLASYKTVLFFAETTPAQQDVLQYLQKDIPLSGNYTSAEQEHLNDVKGVMNGADTVFFLLLAVWGFLFWKEKNKTKMVLYGGYATLGIIVLVLMVLANFDVLFTLFHQIFFPQGNWQFPADSLLIQTFPFSFFYATALKIFILATLLGIIFILLGLYRKYVLENDRR